MAINNHTELITSIYREARERNPDAFVRWVADQVPRVIPCDAQTWVYLLPDRATNRYKVLGDDIFGVDDIERFIADYELVKTQDPLTWRTVQTPGHAVFFDIDNPASPVERGFVEFTKKYDMPRSCMMSFAVPKTRTLHFYSIMRGASAPPFNDSDAANLELLFPHLVQARIHCQEFSLKSRMLDFWSQHNSIATLTGTGDLVYIDDEFVEVIKRIWPQTTEGVIPDALRELMDGEGLRSIRRDGYVFRHVIVDSVNRIVATRLGLLDKLSDREIEIGQLFADGNDHKMIASSINRSAATVRNHLRNIYQKLGVKSRSELADIISRLSPLR